MVDNISPFSPTFSDSQHVDLIILYPLKSLGGMSTAGEQWDPWCYHQNYLIVLFSEDSEMWHKDKNKEILKASGNNTPICYSNMIAET